MFYEVQIHLQYGSRTGRSPVDFACVLTLKNLNFDSAIRNSNTKFVLIRSPVREKRCFEVVKMNITSTTDGEYQKINR